MTDITALAQSLKNAASKALIEEGLTWFSEEQLSHEDGIALHKADAEFIALANPANVLALVEALEKSEKTSEARREAIDVTHKRAARERDRANAAEEALEKAQQRNAELEAQNEYIRKRYQQLDLLIGKNILVMQAAIIEWQATGDAKNGLAWIYNTLFGPGELPDEAEKDAQAYFDRKYAPLDEELMALHKWFWEQSEAERAAAGIKVEAE